MITYECALLQNIAKPELTRIETKKIVIILRYYWDEEVTFCFIQMAHAFHLPRWAKQDYLKWTWGEEVKELSAVVEYRERGLPVLSVDSNTYQPLQC